MRREGRRGRGAGQSRGSLWSPPGQVAPAPSRRRLGWGSRQRVRGSPEPGKPRARRLAGVGAPARGGDGEDDEQGEDDQRTPWRVPPGSRQWPGPVGWPWAHFLGTSGSSRRRIGLLESRANSRGSGCFGSGHRAAARGAARRLEPHVRAALPRAGRRRSPPPSGAATWRPGLRLPAERVLAKELAVSRGTVVAAYQELRDEGLIESRRGSGTRVAVGAAASGDLRPLERALGKNQLMRRYMEERSTDVIDLALGSLPALPAVVGRAAGGGLVGPRADGADGLRGARPARAARGDRGALHGARPADDAPTRCSSPPARSRRSRSSSRCSWAAARASSSTTSRTPTCSTS